MHCILRRTLSRRDERGNHDSNGKNFLYQVPNKIFFTTYGTLRTFYCRTDFIVAFSDLFILSYFI